MLEENGFHQAKIKNSENRDERERQVEPTSPPCSITDSAEPLESLTIPDQREGEVAAFVFGCRAGREEEHPAAEFEREFDEIF